MADPGFLRNLRITRVDRVDAGANPDAHIVLYKAMGPLSPSDHAPVLGADGMCTICGQPQSAHAMGGGAGYTKRLIVPDRSIKKTGAIVPELDKTKLDPEVVKLIEDMEAQLASTKTDLDAKTTELTALAAMPPETVAALLDLEVVAKKAPDPAADETIPEPVRKRLEEAERVAKANADEVAVLRKSQRTTEFITKAKDDFSELGTPGDLGPVLMDIADAAPDAYAKMEVILKGANASMNEAATILSKERGTNLTGDTTVEAEITTLAKAKSDADPKLSNAKLRSRKYIQSCSFMIQELLL